jgi:predicted nuclease of predicted toxin-antitoxin system
MKLLFDQNISHRILQFLPEEFDGSSHVKTEGLINLPDRQIWDFAKQRDFIIVTQDSDFNDLNSLYGFPPKIIWVRAGNLSTKAIFEILMDHLSNLQSFIDDPNFGSFEIIRLKNK